MELLKREELKKAILDDFKALAKKSKLFSYEIPKVIRLLADPFTIESGLLTPTMKIKRHEAKIKFIDILNELYAEKIHSKL